MNVYRLKYDNIPENLPKSVCCIGYFDGVHRGHQTLIKEAATQAEKMGLASGLITFDPDPWVIFKPDSNLSHLMSLEDKEHMAENLGIDDFYILQFSKDFAALSYEQFHQLLKQMNVSKLIAGFDFHYGRKNEGSPQTLKKQNNFDVQIIDSVNEDLEKISSTRIEGLIGQGNVEKAGELLGFYYSIKGNIAHGYRRGTTLLDFPTANIQKCDHYILPGEGVYLGIVQYDHRFYPAMINVGKNPTFNNKGLTIEANIFDFDENIYGKSVRFYFLKKIRDVIKFESFDLLKKQLQSDRDYCKRIVDLNNPLWQKTAALFKKDV